MKMVKSLLLGSAAGLLAVAGAQAADMPVKAAPVEYVKVCSLYGAGFYYVPGTDVCVKIGGYVRAQYYVGSSPNPPLQSGIMSNDRVGNTAVTTTGIPNNNDFYYRARGLVTMDTRAQTDWGTVRTYFNLGLQYTGSSISGSDVASGVSSSPYYTRAFIQWAGFTFGLAQSFFDAFPQGSFMYWAAAFGDTSDAGNLLAAYTTQWGNGLSSTISVEAPRRQGVYNVTTDASFGLNTSNNDTAAINVPDVVSNIRIDQAWGSFQVMSALHQAAAAYYFLPCDTAAGTTVTGSMDCSHPSDKFGWAVGAAGVINLPFLAKGDQLGFQVAYAEGATRYVNNLGSGNPVFYGGSYSVGWGTATDGILTDYAPGTTAKGNLELTQSWGFIAAYQHLWTPFLKTSVYGGGYEVNYNGTASDYICQNVSGIGNVNLAGCSPDYALWFVGSRTQWNIRPDFYMGVDLIYQSLETAFAGSLQTLGTQNGRPAGVYKVEDQDALSVTFRVHRDILP